MTVYLVPIGGGRLELYSEAPDEPRAADDDRGRTRRWLRGLGARWEGAVKDARLDDGGRRGVVTRWKDQSIRALAESIAEQRTLWALRPEGEATLVYPSDLDAAAARRKLDDALADARRHHRGWFAADSTALVASGLLALIPGPNLIAYYFAARVIGHYLSWGGAAQALDRITWTLRPDASLAELGALAALPREARGDRVAAIAAGLNLPRLTAFFDRAAVPAA